MPNVELMNARTRSNMPTLLWAVILASVARMTAFVRQRGGAEFTEIDTSAMVGIGLVALCLLLLLASGNIGPTWRRVARTSGGLLVAYYILCAASALWSPLPEYTLFTSVEMAGLMLAVFVALSYCGSFAQAERRVMLVCVLTILLGMLVNVRFYGVTASLANWHTNSYSASAAMLSCYAVGEYLSRGKELPRAVKWAGGAGLVALALGTSSASTIAALGGFAVAAFVLRRWGLVFGGLAAAALVVALGFGGQFMTNILFPGKTEGQIATLHGRIQLWTAYAEDVKQSPLFGNGFGVSARLSSFRYTTNPHNAVFSVLLGTGAAGMLVVLGALLRLTRESWLASKLRRPGATGATAAIAAGLANSMALPVIGDQWMAPSAVFAALLALHVLFVVGTDNAYADEPLPNLSANLLHS